MGKQLDYVTTSSQTVGSKPVYHLDCNSDHRCLLAVDSEPVCVKVIECHQRMPNYRGWKPRPGEAEEFNAAVMQHLEAAPAVTVEDAASTCASEIVLHASEDATDAEQMFG